MRVKVLNVRLLPAGKPLKAFIDLGLDEILIRDFRVVQEDGKRPHVKVPFLTYRDSTGQLRFRSIVILPDEVKGEVDLAVLNAYRGEKERKNSGSKPK
jgi:hypothetical protein